MYTSIVYVTPHHPYTISYPTLHMCYSTPRVDLASRQLQYVRYDGAKVAAPNPNGWLKSTSEVQAAQALHAQAQRLCIAGGSPGGGQAGLQPGADARACRNSLAIPAALTSLRLVITDSPAEFCLPQPRCRAFKPHFQAKVRCACWARCVLCVLRPRRWMHSVTTPLRPSPA